MSELTARLDMPLGLEAPAAARHILHPLLRGWGYREEQWLADAMVVVSELVSNAVRHCGACLELQVRAHEDTVTILVADGSSVIPRRREADADGGRGLALMEGLSTRWGIENYEGGKRVWVDLLPYPSARLSDRAALR